GRGRETAPQQARGRETAPQPVEGVPADGRVVLCVGSLEMQRGFQEAIWALDILHYVHRDLHLVLIGEGPDRARLEAFAAAVLMSTRVHFLGGGAGAPAPVSRGAEGPGPT